MAEDVLIKVEEVSKKFCRRLRRSLWYGLKDMAGEALGRNRTHDTLRRDEFWAVRDVSFELRRGECLGLIGHNGAGKTTLLKMLNGLIKPDKGRIRMRGRVGALIALGAGFNPILTGRENIYVNASILGFSKSQIDNQLDSIVDFAGISDSIDAPVQNYSSGMQVRLGFAIASALVPDILLIDEVLAVGDAGFRIKCYNRINELKPNSAIILVSHAMEQISKVCDVGLVLDSGSLILGKAPLSDAISSYFLLSPASPSSSEGIDSAAITSVELVQLDVAASASKPWKSPRQPVPTLSPESPIQLQARIHLSQPISHLSILWSITSLDHKTVAQAKSQPIELPGHGETFTLTTKIASLQLNTGGYLLSVHLFQGDARGWSQVLAGVRNAIQFSIERKFYSGSAPIQYTSLTLCS